MIVANGAAETITILGSTGSIGCNAIKVITHSTRPYRVEAITARSSVELLARQARQLQAKLAVIADESLYFQLKEALSGSGIEVQAGENAVVEAAAQPADIVMSAIVGAAGLLPTMAAIRQGTRIALANKECLVCAGELMMQAVAEHGATLIPVDSEHNAIFQVFNKEQCEAVSKIILTASGGPFRNHSLEQMKSVTPEQAVTHPNWNMGAKISVDSATMMNKGLEVIEAYHLFPVRHDQIDVVVHPESIIHSMVEYVDGSVLAQMGTPDMCTPIAVALAWPQRIALEGQKLDLLRLGRCTFEAVDETRFAALPLAHEALREGGSMPAVFNTANEVAVAAFLAGKIGFLDIVPLVRKVMETMECKPLTSLEGVVEVLTDAHKKATALL